MSIDKCCHNSPSANEDEKLDSINGSNKTVKSPSVVLGKRKRTDEGDEGAESKTIPWQLHIMILKAVELRQVKNDSDTDLIDYCEYCIRSLVKRFKKLKQLPHDWIYDPATASTFVSVEVDISTPREKRDVLLRDALREAKKAMVGNNYTDTESESASEDKYDSESESLNKELKKDLGYKNDSASEPGASSLTCLDSIKGSNKTVESPSAVLGKRKRTDEGDGDAASKLIPWDLHRQIQDVLEFRAEVMQYKLKAKKALTGKNYSESELVSGDKNNSGSDSDDYLDVQLKECEDGIRYHAKRYKKLKQLPLDWEYDPATASTFVAAEDDISELPRMIPPKEIHFGFRSWMIDPNRKFPKAADVPLDEEEKKIWMDFIEFDKDKLGLDEVVNFATVHKHDIPLDLDNPIVSLTSKFAVTAFNEAIEMFVKKGERNNIHDIDVVECKYLKMNMGAYYFYITIEAFEERKRGVYDTKVRLKWDDGTKSLMHFVLTDRKPHVLKETMKRKTHPDSWQDGSCISYSGMGRRKNRRSICRGYDYRTPWGHGGP